MKITSRGRGRRPRGQSVVEFGLLVPVLLAFVGLTVDIARVFSISIALEAATRDAAEYAATVATDATTAASEAQRVVCSQSKSIGGFVTGPGGDDTKCTTPTVTLSEFSISTSAAGASTRYPIARATVRSVFPFKPLFAYPFVTVNGTWLVTAEQSYNVIQGR